MTIDLSHLEGSQKAKIMDLARELAMRQVEPLSLYDPLSGQAEFHKSRARQRLLFGSNRGGKSTPAAVETGRAVLGRDPYNKYPKKNGVVWMVGQNEDHIANVIWHKLTREGLRIIRDDTTKRWRTYIPDQDGHREHEATWSAPILPSRYFASEPAWTSKKRGVPKMVRLHTGWEIHFFTENSAPRRGAAVDLIWFDEENHSHDWYYEIQMRLLDRSGRFIWSASAQSGCDTMYDLVDQAEEQAAAENPDPTVETFKVHIDDNKYIGTKAKALVKASIRDERELEVRYHGNLEMDRLKVYYELKKDVHVCQPFPIPAAWTRYLAIDPGHQVLAVLFAAVTPKEKQESHRVYFYKELYLRNADADMFGRAMREACQGEEIEQFILDMKGGSLTDIGSGEASKDQYAEKLKQYNVFCNATQYQFTPGLSDVGAGILHMKEMLRLRADGKPEVQIFSTLTNTLSDLRNYPMGRDSNGRPTDKPSSKGKWHGADCARYLASSPLRFIKRAPKMDNVSPAMQAWLADKAARDKGRSGYQTIILGPGGGLYQQTG